MDDGKKSHTAYDRFEAAVGVSSWMVCSVGMLLCNKRAIHSFPVPCTLVGIQFAFTAVVVVAVARSSIHIGSRSDVLRWARVIPFFSGMILSSILALKYAPMTLVITMRALSPLISLPFEMLFPTPIRISLPMILALMLSLVGAGMYIFDMEWNSGSIAGVGWALANNFLAVVDRLLQRMMLSSEQDPVDISKPGVTLLNNVLGMVPLFIGGLLSNEFASVPEAIGGLDSLKMFWVISSCVVGAGISYTGIWVASLISATSFLVLINANKFLIIFLEVFIMKVKHLTSLQVAGATLSILAGVAYGKARDVAHAEEETESEEEEDDDETDTEKK
jgi:hypothetical protein